MLNTNANVSSTKKGSPQTKKLVAGMMKNESPLHFVQKKMQWITDTFQTQTFHHFVLREILSMRETSLSSQSTVVSSIKILINSSRMMLEYYQMIDLQVTFTKNSLNSQEIQKSHVRI